MDIRSRNSTIAILDLSEAKGIFSPNQALRLRCGRKNYSWISIHTSTINSMELGAQVWSDLLFLHNAIDPLELPYCCDGCREKISIDHTLNCKKHPWHGFAQKYSWQDHRPGQKVLHILACSLKPPNPHWLHHSELEVKKIGDSPTTENSLQPTLEDS